ncbi:MAG TPA: DUF4962 domain-containing protein [Clostridia bacterium]|nr:DUF4962 domain-containing protein [Clostridia bacterium]
MKRSALLAILLFVSFGFAQDSREQLGPADKPAKNKSPHPLVAVMNSVNAKLRPELTGKHPRVFFTEDDFSKLIERSRTTHRDQWKVTVSRLLVLKNDPPPPPADARRLQNTVGIAMAEGAFAYRIDRDPKLLAAVKRYMDAAVSYDIWGYRTNKPDVDLAAGHLLYGMGTAYDLLYNEFTPEERKKYREKITLQARKLYTYYLPKTGRSYSYSQNHVFIPVAGLGVAAYALYDEVPDAPEWAKLSRAIYDRVLATYSGDGYYYEGFEYWVFSTPWIIHYLDAHSHSTGEDLYDLPGLKKSHLYLAHSLLPDGQYVFDFGDVFEGPLTRAKQGEDYRRSHPQGRFHTNFNLLFRLAQRYKNPEIQGVAKWMESLGHSNAEDFWSLAWVEPDIKPVPIEQLSPSHYFSDHEVVYWRSSWSKSAVAFAFKCGPPEGHKTAELVTKFTDWHLSNGHAHPDANSFILYANGKVLTGDSGYAGVPMTEQHNTVLVDGRGQAAEGKGHDAFSDMPYSQLNDIKITGLELLPQLAFVRGDATAAYAKDLAVQKFYRTLIYNGREFIIWDELATGTPRKFTSLLISDEAIKSAEGRFDLSGASVQIISPEDALASIEPNTVRAPGPPGSVDKGPLRERGYRLRVEQKAAATQAGFVTVIRPSGPTESAKTQEIQ